MPQVWKEGFAHEMERQGIAAEATPSLKKISFKKQRSDPQLNKDTEKSTNSVLVRAKSDSELSNDEIS